MSKRSCIRVLATFAFLFLSASPAAAQEALGEGPIVITSETLVADNQERSAVFKGSVVARNGDMTLSSDMMTVFYSEDGGVGTIEAEGSVKLTRGERVVLAEHAVFHGDERKVVFTGNPRALEGANVVTGTRMTYLIDDDRFIVEGSKVFIEQKTGGEED